MGVSDIMQDAAAWRALINEILQLTNGDVFTAEIVGIQVQIMLPETYSHLEKLAFKED